MLPPCARSSVRATRACNGTTAAAAAALFRNERRSIADTNYLLRAAGHEARAPLSSSDCQDFQIEAAVRSGIHAWGKCNATSAERSLHSFTRGSPKSRSSLTSHVDNAAAPADSGRACQGARDMAELRRGTT